LGDEHAIEGILVQRGKIFDRDDVITADGQFQILAALKYGS
jgi:hypothetical protein